MNTQIIHITFRCFHAEGNVLPTLDLVLIPHLKKHTHLAPKGLRGDPSPLAGFNLPTIAELGTLNLLQENGRGRVVQKTPLAANVSPGYKSRRCCHTQD